MFAAVFGVDWLQSTGSQILANFECGCFKDARRPGELKEIL